MLNRRPHQRDLRKGRHSEAGLCYFVTTATKNREPLFLRPAAAHIMLDALKWLDTEGRITLFAAVVMPDHVHFVAQLKESRQDSGPTSRAMQPEPVGAPSTPQSVGAPSTSQSVGAPSRCDRLRKDAAPTEYTILSRVMHSLKSFTANEINKVLGRRGQVWERGYYEKGLRDEKALLKTARYCLENPVREGLVDDFRRYPYWHCIYEV